MHAVMRLLGLNIPTVNVRHEVHGGNGTIGNCLKDHRVLFFLRRQTVGTGHKWLRGMTNSRCGDDWFYVDGRQRAMMRNHSCCREQD